MPRQQMTSVTATQPLLYLNLRPFYLVGLFGVLFAGPFMRGLFFPAELLTAQLIISAAFVFCIGDYLLRRESLRPQPQDWAMLALLAAYALSMLSAVHLRPAVGELMEMAAAVMVYWMAARACPEEKDLDRLLTVLFIGACGVALVGFLAAAGLLNVPGAYVNGVINSTLQYRNTLAVYLVFGSLLGLGLSTKVDHLWPKLLLAAGNVLLITVIMLTQSRGGWILYPLAVAAYLALLPLGYRWRALYHFGIPLGAALALSRPIYAALSGSAPAAVLSWLGIGVLAAALLQTGYHYLGRWLNRPQVPEHVRRLVVVGGLAYILIVGGFYLLYAGGVFSMAAEGLVPAKIAQRATTISGADSSFQARLEYSRYALAMALDHSLTGTGGGGWNALYHQYQQRSSWSSEVHNHFLQVWVEAGILGFAAFLALWVFTLRSLRRYYRHAPRDGLWVSLFALATALVTLGLHSALDFDLSLPALAFILYAGLGVVRSCSTLRRRSSSSPAPRRSRGQPSHAQGSSTPQPAPSGPRPGPVFLLSIGAAVVIAGALGWTSWRFYMGGIEGASGARAILAQDFTAAESHLQQARKLDPYTASYAVDLAQVYALRTLQDDDAVAHYQALEQARDAARLAPYDAQLRGALLNVYSAVREPRLALTEARRLVDANPVFAPNYEVLGRVLISAAVKSLQDGDTRQAAVYVDEAQELPERLARRSAPEKTHQEEAPTPALTLVLGQVAYLEGDDTRAQGLLSDAGKRDQNLSPDAGPWLAAAALRAGDQETSAAVLAGLTDPEAPRLCRELIALPVLHD